MKRVLLLGVTFVIFLFKSSAQDNVWTSGKFDDYLDVDTNRPTSSISEGINIGRHYSTNIQLATKTHSGHHAIFFNAYKSNNQVSGNLIKAGNSKFANSTTSYGNGAGLISFFGNGGTLDFYISDVSTGEDTNVLWGIPKLRIRRNGKVGIGLTDPQSKLHIFSGSSGGSPHSFSKVTVEHDDNAMFTVITPNDKNGYFGFADNDDDFVGGLTYYHSSDDLGLRVNDKYDPDLLVKSNGNVGIGNTNPSYKLVVDGTISAKEVKVSTTPNSDYVFESDYKLRPIEDVEAFVKENKHLPDIPSAEEFKENGVGLGEMDDMLLRKVEELTLYVIEQNEKLEKLMQENKAQNKRIKMLEVENQRLRNE